MTYDKAIEWLYSTQLFGIKLGLENPRRLLREYLAFPPRATKVIHVAGTNGKGSTCAFIDAVSRATGNRTGLFTSPHLVRYNERVRISGVEISDDDVARHLTALRGIAESWDTHPTFFELTLALAMKQFTEQACDLVVLETGMGGRLDATTAVPADVAVLTSIALDHQQWLGDSLAAIAAEKAAIIVPKKPAITTPQPPEVQAVIAQEANERRAPLEVIEEPLRGYALGLPGAHQGYNAAAALAALHAAGIPLGYESVKAGLGAVHHPGRFETLPASVAHTLKVESEITLDIAHNPSAAEALAATWRAHPGHRRAALVFGA
ncbi:MAG: bifunctional folylpolyglutamate synthase/dihydrofolate synthase, partial [Akkermansiaceae bacterium]|nr:bifunctional folylpolyglutamate synthase/dihydrofolate synthase [Akkermansiaceae bacterium]